MILEHTSNQINQTAKHSKTCFFFHVTNLHVEMVFQQQQTHLGLLILTFRRAFFLLLVLLNAPPLLDKRDKSFIVTIILIFIHHIFNKINSSIQRFIYIIYITSLAINTTKNTMQEFFTGQDNTNINTHLFNLVRFLEHIEYQI